MKVYTVYIYMKEKKRSGPKEKYEIWDHLKGAGALLEIPVWSTRDRVVAETPLSFNTYSRNSYEVPVNGDSSPVSFN